MTQLTTVKQHPTNLIYFIIKLNEGIHYIFKNNILRFRLQKDSSGIGAYFLQFIFKGGDKISFHLDEENGKLFKSTLPNPGIITAIGELEEFSNSWRENEN
jgi:hypothetical protein